MINENSYLVPKSKRYGKSDINKYLYIAREIVEEDNKNEEDSLVQ